MVATTSRSSLGACSSLRLSLNSGWRTSLGSTAWRALVEWRQCRYDAIREGLERVAEFALSRGATIHMPRIGAGLAGGDWSVIERLVDEALSDRGLDVTVYDLPPRC